MDGKYLCDQISPITDGEFKGIEVTRPRTLDGKDASGQFAVAWNIGWEHYPVNGGSVKFDQDYEMALVADDRAPNRGQRVGVLTYESETQRMRALFHKDFPRDPLGRMDNAKGLTPQQALLENYSGMFEVKRQ